jgi:hypothetical protein
MGLLQFPSNSMHPYSKLLTRTSEKANEWLIQLTIEMCWVFCAPPLLALRKHQISLAMIDLKTELRTDLWVLAEI